MAPKKLATKRRAAKAADADLPPTFLMPFALGMPSRRHHVTLRRGLREIRPYVIILAEQERLLEEGLHLDEDAMANLRGTMISVASLLLEVEQTCSKERLGQDDAQIKYDLLKEALEYIQQGVAEIDQELKGRAEP